MRDFAFEPSEIEGKLDVWGKLNGSGGGHMLNEQFCDLLALNEKS